MKKTLSTMMETIVKALGIVITLAIVLLAVCGLFGIDRKAVGESIGKALLKTVDKDSLEEVIHEEAGKVLKTDRSLSAATVSEIARDARKMVTQEYEYEEVGQHIKYRELIGKKIPFTTDEILFSFEATVFVGVDLAELEVGTVDNDKKTITLSLPKATIISHEVNEDSFEYYDVKNSIFVSSTMDEYIGEIAAIKEKKETELTEKGTIFKAAEQGAEVILKELLLSNEATKDYKLVFEWR